MSGSCHEETQVEMLQEVRQESEGVYSVSSGGPPGALRIEASEPFAQKEAQEKGREANLSGRFAI